MQSDDFEVARAPNLKANTMANRTLRYAANGQLMALATNPQHELAHNNSLAIYGSDAVYSMIPKNACS